jgi:hypothetical protein
MTGIGLRFAISVASMAASLVVFMSLDDPWIAAAVIAGILILSAMIERVVWPGLPIPKPNGATSRKEFAIRRYS